MTLSADFALAAIDRDGRSGCFEGVAVLVPDFQRLRAQSTSAWESLVDLFRMGEWISRRYAGTVLRSQGKLYFILNSLEEIQLVHDLVAAQSKASFGRRPAPPSYWKPLGSSSLQAVQTMWRGEISDALLLGTACYLAVQAARLPMARQDSADENRVLSFFEESRSLGHAAREQLVKSLYAVPLGGRLRHPRLDDLELWSQHQRPERGENFAVLTDVHGTERTFSRDLVPIAERFLRGSATFTETVSKALHVRQRHNALFDVYFENFRGTEPSLFRASGDGLAGFATDVSNLVDAEHRASSLVDHRLTSGVAVVQVTSDLRAGWRALDDSIAMTKQQLQ